MKTSFLKENSQLIKEVKLLLKPRPFNVLVPHFPPFTIIEDDTFTGPLVELLKQFANLVSKTPTFITAEDWDYEDQILSGSALTIAAPIYERQRLDLSIYRFCRVKTGYCFINNKKVRPSFRRSLGKIYALIDSINMTWQKHRKNPDEKILSKEYERKYEELRTCVGELLDASPKKQFAIPAGYEELHIVTDFKFRQPQIILCGANDRVLEQIIDFANSGYIVLCNSVVGSLLQNDLSEVDYTCVPLLKDGIPTWAGIPFSEKDDHIGKLFGAFLCSEEPIIEELLDACELREVEILTPDKRKINRFTATASLAWIARLNQSADYSDLLLEDPISEINADLDRKVLDGTVYRIDSFDDNAKAVVQLQDNENSRLIKIKVRTLSIKGLAYSGAKFKYVKQEKENGHYETYLIPDEDANARKREEVEMLFKEFADEYEKEKTIQHKTPHNDA